jgi:hypothetical protein
MEEKKKKEDVMFDGYEAENGKKFPFVQLTMTQVARMNRKLFKPGFWRSVGIAVATLVRREDLDKRWWKKIRSIAFAKRGLWRVGIVPKELRCSNIPFVKAVKCEEDFFVYAREIANGSNAQSSSQNLYRIQNSRKKEVI